MATASIAYAHPYRAATAYRVTTVASEMHVYRCEMDLALTHAASSKLSRKRQAIASLERCLLAGIRMKRPDLTFQAAQLLTIVRCGVCHV